MTENRLPRLGATLRMALPCLLLLVSQASAGIRERLRNRLDPSMAEQALRVRGDVIHCRESLPRFYLLRGYEPAWFAQGSLSPQADSLLSVIQGVVQEGLEPQDYHAQLLEDLLREEKRRSPGDEESLSELLSADLELALTDAFLLLGSHCLAGHIDPEQIDPEWSANRRRGDLVPVLEQALRDEDIPGALKVLLPPQPGYEGMKSLLRRVQEEPAPEDKIPAGVLLKPGMSDPRIPLIDERLRWHEALAGFPEEARAGTVYDERMVVRLKRFQAAVGLEDDGILGPATLDELNRGSAERLAQIQVNMERWRWLPQDLGRRHILVNAAAQELQVVEDGRVIRSMRVIVGRNARRTPVFSGTISYLVFAPYWQVPPKLAVEDKLPILRKDPASMQRQGFQVFSGWGEQEVELDLLAIDWKNVSGRAFPYRLRQKPGPQNALGFVKFMFPNKHSVYLHDTPGRELFRKSRRDFSSGCIRVEDPEFLARTLLADLPAWTPEAIREAMGAPEERTVSLRTPWPVHLEYWTAWVDEQGQPHFRTDLYGRDARVLDALRQPRPEAQ